MNEKDFVYLIQEGLLSDELEDEGIKNITTFKNAGVLTNDKGLVVTMEDGEKFYVTVQKA